MKKIVLALTFFTVLSCNQNSYQKDVRAIEIFQETEVWGLARLAADQNVEAFSKAVPMFEGKLDAQEQEYGFTLLMWCIKMESYEKAEILLQHGANPNVRSENGKTALFYATEYSWLDNKANEDARFVELLLRYNADPNIPYAGDGRSNVIDKGTSPLIHAASRSLEKVVALVNGGADINYRTKRSWTAANQALLNTKVNIANYLIVENKADVTQPYYYFFPASDSINFEDKRYPVELLRDWVFELGSEEHKAKMQIVEAFKRQGVNYGNTDPSTVTLNQIKKLYPEKWEDYLRKY